MTRPGSSVKSPAITSAPENRDHGAAMFGDLVPVRPQDGQRKHDQHDDRQQVNRAPGTDQPDLVDPEELIATVTMSRTQTQPTVRWGKVPFGAANWTRPSTKANIAAKAWSEIAGAASNCGA